MISLASRFTLTMSLQTGQYAGWAHQTVWFAMPPPMGTLGASYPHVQFAEIIAPISTTASFRK
ncbi:MAG: hypothetical protein KDI69_06070, partial [Xanthomonadales bacterium]|nr:hypothetical protein [Xanthomonadales bacterium]